MAEMTEEQRAKLLAEARNARLRAAARRAGASPDVVNFVGDDSVENARSNLPWGYAGTPGNFRPDVATPSQGGAAARSALQGLTFGFGDEIVGAGQSMMSGVPYETARDFEKERLTRGREEFPKTTTAAEIGGAVVPSVLLGYGALPNTGTVPQRMAVGAGIGGAEGSLYGAGSADPGNRPQGALYGGALGVGVGAAIPAATGTSKALVGRPAATALGIGNANRGRQAVVRSLINSGKSGDDISEYLAKADAAGQPAIAADAMGVEGQRLFAGAARQPGPGRTTAVDFLNQRQIDQGDRVSGFIREGFDMDSYVPMSGGPQTAMAREEATRAARGAGADISYSAARNNAGPVDVRNALSIIDNRIGGMQGSGVAGDSIDGRLASFRSRLAANTPPNGEVSRELSDFDRVLGVKQDVQDAIGAAVRAGRNNEARELGKLSSALDQALEASSEGYRTANDAFRTASREIDAVGTGASFNKPGTRTADVASLYGRMSPSEQVAARVGFGDSLLGKVENSAAGVNTARPFTSARMAGNIETMANNPRQTLDNLAREGDMFETRAAVTGGSKTADNLADAGMANGQDVAMVANALSGNTVGAGRDLINRVLGGLAGRNEKTREEIVRLLMARDPQTLNQAYQMVAQGGGVRNVIESAIRGGSRGAAVPRMAN